MRDYANFKGPSEEEVEAAWFKRREALRKERQSDAVILTGQRKYVGTPRMAKHRGRHVVCGIRVK